MNDHSTVTKAARCGLHHWPMFGQRQMLLSLLYVVVNLANIITCLESPSSTVDLIEYNLEEEVLAYSFVGDVASDSRIRHLFNRTVLEHLQFTILPRNGDRKSGADIFTVTRNDGIIRVRSIIDRDGMCRRRVVCTVNLDVAILGPPDVFRIAKVRIRIVDVNDNAPVFAEEHVSRQIPENTETGTSFSVPAADDPDSPAYGVTRYWIRDEYGVFALKVSNGSGSSLDVHLILMKTVDRETERSHRVVVMAADGGAPSRTGSMTVDVAILDVNDNHPLFEHARYDVTITEDWLAGSVLTTVRAVDLDSGRFGEIVYGFSDNTLHLYGDLFSIDAVNGTIAMSVTLDYETTSEYCLVATAGERHGNAIPAETTVYVLIGDVNDNRPDISVNALASNGHVQVPESAVVGSFVAYVSVVDADSGDNGVVSCRLVGDDAFGLEMLFPGEFKLETKAALDRELLAEYEMKITCHDLGTPALTSSAVIKITVLDENDNAPMFSKQTYMATVYENNAAGAVVGHVTATDADSGVNGMVSYRIHGTAQRYLNIDRITGALTAKLSFDHEHVSTVRAVIEASDNSSVLSRTSSAVFVLTIQDVNDNSPTFSSPLFEFVVQENGAAGTQVGQVSATDADGDPYDTFTFSFVGSVTEFTMDESSGEIFTVQPLDRENRSRYDLVVVATDRLATGLSSSARVTINIDDVKDKAPVVTFPSPSNFTVNVSPRSRVGHEVTRVVASDADVGRNALLKFGMMRYNRFFDVDAETGVVFVQRHLAEITDTSVVLFILVKDSGKPPKSVEVILTVVVSGSTTMDVTSSSSLLGGRGLIIIVSVGMTTVLLAVFVVVAIVTIRRRAAQRHKLECLRRFFSNQTIDLKESESGGDKVAEQSNDTSWDGQLPTTCTLEEAVDDTRAASVIYPIMAKTVVQKTGHSFEVDITDELPASELDFLQHVSIVSKCLLQRAPLLRQMSLNLCVKQCSNNSVFIIVPTSASLTDSWSHFTESLDYVSSKHFTMNCKMEYAKVVVSN